MGFFDFLLHGSPYREDPLSVVRLNRRHDFLIEPYRNMIHGARVLDLGAHDGRWSLAFAAAGAREVVGIEARPELVARFDRWRHLPFHDRVDLRQGELFAALEHMVQQCERFDIVAVFGILYHLMDHMRLFLLIRELAPRTILVDSEFILRPGPIIRLVRERTDNILNAAPQYPEQRMAIKGVPSYLAFERIVEAAGFAVHWHDWSRLDPHDRRGVQDYFRQGEMRRASCSLRQIAAAGIQSEPGSGKADRARPVPPPPSGDGRH